MSSQRNQRQDSGTGNQNRDCLRRVGINWKGHDTTLGWWNVLYHDWGDGCLAIHVGQSSLYCTPKVCALLYVTFSRWGEGKPRQEISNCKQHCLSLCDHRCQFRSSREFWVGGKGNRFDVRNPTLISRTDLYFEMSWERKKSLSISRNCKMRDNGNILVNLGTI